MPDASHSLTSADLSRLILEREYYRELWLFALDRAERAEAMLPMRKRRRATEPRNIIALDRRAGGKHSVKSKSLAA